MSGYTSEIEKSQKTFEYFLYVKNSNADIYSSKAAKHFDVKQPRAAKVLSDLENWGVLESSKKGRKRVYKTNISMLIPKWYDLWSEYVGEKRIEEAISEIGTKKFEEVLEIYINQYLEFCITANIQSTFEEMLVDNFVWELERTAEIREDVTWLQKLAFFLKESYNSNLAWKNIFNQAIEEYEQERN